MKTLFPKLRGAVGIGLTWGILWAAIGYTVSLVIGFFDPDSIDPGESPIFLGAILGVVGFVSGVGFGAVLSFIERKKTILDLSLIRVAIWGIIGSAALPLLTSMQNSLILFACPLGAVFAAASVAVARKGELYTPVERNRVQGASRIVSDST